MTNATTLTEYDFVLVLDGSGSMGETDMVGGRTRWDAMQENVLAFTRDICAIDSDGIGLVLFNGGTLSVHDGVDAAKVKDVLSSRSPRGSTPLAEALGEAFKLAGKSAKKDFILVITDGVPDDRDAVARALVAAANKQESDEDLTVLFVQIGYDSAATSYLSSLDNNLKGAKFDIVDAKTMKEAEAFATTTDLVLAAIAD